MNARKSLLFSFLDRYASLVVTVASSMVLARLLTPAQVGIFAVAMALISLASTVRDLGAGNYIVQEKELTTDRVRAAWALQLGVGVVLAVVTAALSVPAAHFYAEPRIRDIMLLLALNFVITPFGSITYSWLMRAMRYDALAVTRFVATATGAAVSIGLAAHGRGPISLAWGSLAAAVANATTSLFFRPPDYPWKPGLREIKRVLSFGTRMTSSSIATTIANGAPEFLLGKWQGLSAAGHFSRANGLVAMFARLVTDAVYSVALSMFAKESRVAHDSSASLLRALSYLSVLGWSFAAGIAFLAYPIVRLLYGPQWDDSVDVARVLALAMACSCLIPVYMAALTGVGAVQAVLRASTLSAIIGVGCAAAGAALGMGTLALAMLLAAVLGSAVWLRETQRVVDFRWRDLGSVFVRSGAVAVLAGLGPALSFWVFGARPDTIAAPLALGVALGAIGLVAGLAITDHPLVQELARVRAAARSVSRRPLGI